MSFAEPPSPRNPPDDAAVAPKNDSARNRTLTKEALARLLHQFSPDGEDAARKYLVMQVKLIRYFEWQGCFVPEELASRTLNRVAGKIEQGANIINLNGYFRTVAYNIYLEWLKEPDRNPQPFEEIPEIPFDPPPEDEEKEARLRCLDECLEKQSSENRELILGYYENVRRAKIDHRRKLAEASTMNALRIRVCRIRKDLEKCVRECLKRSEEMNLAPESPR